MDDPTQKKPKNKHSSSNTIPIRISKSTLRQLKPLIQTCNRKTHGKRVKPDDIISKALALITQVHIEEIQHKTFTSQDHLEIQFKKFCSENGNVSKDDFLKMILNKALEETNSQKDS